MKTLRNLPLILTFIVLLSANSPLAEAALGTAYSVEIPGKILTDGSVESSRIYNIPYVDKKDYFPSAIHVKTKSVQSVGDMSKTFYNSTLMTTLSKYNVQNIHAPFARHATDNKLLAEDEIGIGRIYEVYYDSETDPYDVCMELLKNPEIEYAVPIFRRYTMEFTPNDPRYSEQYALQKMEASKAWDISTGSKDVVIAIVDSGTDWEHEDLGANIWTNPNETLNGIDDDGNGKIDDIRGWDFVGNSTINEIFSGIFKENNNPQNNRNTHGTHVAGCAAAVTNNGKGIASLGFNCSILPVQAGSENSSAGQGIYRGYEGIIYAADMGADVINCSWGGPGFSLTEQDVINYAYNKGAIVLAAAGNDKMNIDDGGQYPACYNNLICVGSSDKNDNPSWFTNYGYPVTVYAPGSGILSTLPGNTYKAQDGTSMATPVLAGLVGLMVSMYPQLTPEQIIHQLRSTSDNVLKSDQSLRPRYYGRANAYKALNYNFSNPQLKVPGIAVSQMSFLTGGAITSLAPTKITLTLKNHLASANNVSVTVTPMESYVTLQNTNFTVGSMPASSSKEIQISVQLTNMSPWYSGNVSLLLTYESGEYKDFERLLIPINIPSENVYSRVYAMPSDYTPAWHDASFAGNTVWAAGSGGIMGTGNAVWRLAGGAPDLKQAGNTPVYCVYGIDDVTAFAGTSNNTAAAVIKTTNAGSNWTIKDVSSITNFVNDIHFFDQQNGVFTGDPISGKWGVAVTGDGGNSWNKVSSIPVPQTDEAGFVGSTYWYAGSGWFGTNKGRVYTTANKGIQWDVGTIDADAGLVRKIAFKNNLDGIAIYNATEDEDSDLLCAYTNNGGQTWKKNAYNFSTHGLTPIYAFAPPSCSNIYILCSGGEVYSTSNNGIAWTAVHTMQHSPSTAGVHWNDEFGNVRLWDLGQAMGYLAFSYPRLDAKKEIRLTTSNDLDYGEVYVDDSKIEKVTIENTGNTEVLLTKVNMTYGEDTGEDEFIILGAPPTSVDAGKSVTMRVYFKPKTVGEKSAQMIINSNGIPAEITVNFRGTAAIDPNATRVLITSVNEVLIMDSTEIGSSLIDTLTINNSGNTSIAVNDITISAGETSDEGEFVIISDIPETVYPNGAKDIIIEFVPVELGQRSAMLTIDCNADNAPIELELRAFGKAIVSVLETTPLLYEGIVSPNPSSDMIRVDLSGIESNDLVLTVLNSVGSRMMQKNFNSATEAEILLPVNNLPSGMYILRIQSDRKVITAKFVVER